MKKITDMLRTKVVLNRHGRNRFQLSRAARRRVRELNLAGWEADHCRDNPAMVRVVEEMEAERETPRAPDETDAAYAARELGADCAAPDRPGHVLTSLSIRDVPEGYARRSAADRCYWEVRHDADGEEYLHLLSDTRALDRIEAALARDDAATLDDIRAAAAERRPPNFMIK